MVSTVERFLVVYTLAEWAKVENRIQALAENSAIMRRFRRVMVGRAFECTLDKQDRILIPPGLRELVKLNKEVSLVGQINHFEIWPREEWEKENLEIQKEMENEEFMNEIVKQGLLI
jgi:MraZ protein